MRLRPIHMALMAQVVAVLCAPAQAQDDEVMRHYDAYQGALDQGHVEEAITEGVAAWRAAEQSWGEERDTAVLAYNVAALILRSTRSAEALEPAQRAQAMAVSGVSEPDVPLDDANLVLGLAEHFAEAPSGGVEHMLAGLESRSEEPSSMDDLVALGWIVTGVDARERSRWPKAQERADRALAIARRLGPSYTGYVIDAATLKAVASIARKQYVEARAAYVIAINAYPDGMTPANNPGLASLVAWETAMRAVMDTEYNLQFTTGSRLHDDNGNEEVEESRLVNRGCYRWLGELQNPRFPSSEAARGNYGAVVMAYDMGRSGRVENLRVAGTAPGDISPRFIENIEDAMSEWRAMIPPGAQDDCLNGQFTSFQFYFK